MDLKQYLKDKLSPHFGYLDAFSKFIESGEIKTHDEIDFIIDRVKNKYLMHNLQKNIFGYQNYYFLVNDIFFTEKMLTLIKFIREKLSPTTKKIFIENLKDIHEGLTSIISNENKLNIFLRWSSRIKTKEQALDYIHRILVNENTFDKILKLENTKNIGKYNVLLMKSHDEVRDILPPSWCIANRETFNSYLESTDVMYLILDGLEIYGINIYKDGRIDIMDKNNMMVNNDEICKLIGEL